MIGRLIIGIAALALIVGIATGGVGLYGRQHRPHYTFWNAEGAEVDTAANADSVFLTAYSTQYVGADTAGHPNRLTYAKSDSGGGGWYTTNPTWDIYLVVRDSFGTIDTLADDFLIVGRVLGDSVIADTTVFKANVVPGAAIVSMSGTKLDSGTVAQSKIGAGAIDSTRLASNAVHPPHIDTAWDFAFREVSTDTLDSKDSTHIRVTENLTCDSTLTIGAYTLPITDGANNQILKTDGSGAVTWQGDVTGAGGADYADSLRLSGTTYDADRWFTTALLDTAYTHDAQWEAYIQAHQSGGAGMAAVDFGDSLVNYDGDGIKITDLADIDVLMDVAGGIETVDDSLNVKLDGASLSLSASGLKVTDELTLEELEDYVGAMVSGNVERGIAVTYDDNDAGRGKLDFNVDSLITREMLIWAPDGINDEIEFLKIDALKYPNGVTLIQLSISLPADAAYSMVFEEWAGDPPVAQNDVETVTTTGTDAYMEVAEADIDDKNLDADDMLYLHVPATDVDWIKVMAIFVKD